MGSSLVPIMLIVVLLVGAVVFVVLSSRSPRAGYESGRRRTLETRRARRGAIPLRDTPAPEPPVPTAPPAPDPPAAPAGQAAPVAPAVPVAAAPLITVVEDEPADRSVDDGGAWDDWGVPEAEPADTATSATDGTVGAGHNIGDGEYAYSRDTPMIDSRDPDATGWTPPPSGRPHQTDVDDSVYRLPVDPGTYPDPTAGETQRVGAGVPLHTPPTDLSPESGAAGIVAPEPAHTTAPALRLAAAGRTRRGKRGGPNEDAYVVSDGLLAVSDGVGGEAAGQIASTLSVTTVAGFRPQYAPDPAEGLRAAVARANQVVREKPREEPAWRGMACTLDVVILGRQQATGETLFIAHVGDSSVWLQPQKGRPHQVTTPHAIKNGPLLNAVGLADHIEADILREPVRAGDRVILASDGITKVMTPEQLLGLMTELGAEPPERAADALVEAALLAGARDDTTIVVADVVSEPAAR